MSSLARTRTQSTYVRTMAAPMSPHSSHAMCCHTSPKIRLRRVFDSALLMTTSVSAVERVRTQWVRVRVRVRVGEGVRTQ
jgi:hypothetical protein